MSESESESESVYGWKCLKESRRRGFCRALYSGVEVLRTPLLLGTENALYPLTRFPTGPLLIRVPFFLLFGVNKGTQEKGGKRVLLGNLVGPKPQTLNPINPKNPKQTLVLELLDLE